MKTIPSLASVVFLAMFPAAAALSQSFVSYQAADVVIGKPNFTTNSPTGPSTSRTNVVSDVCVDPATGELFVCDEANNRVLRFTSAAAASSGADADAVFGQPDFVTATANTGGLSATSLNDPEGIFVDASGALWVADAGNNRVLRFDGATGAVSGSTLTADQVIGQANFTTGTAGLTLATLSNPRDAWVAGGVLWVADGGNNRVLRFDAVTGLGDGPSASRVVGQPNGTTNTATTTQTGLSLPNSLCIDGSGALWIADRGNNRVLRFDAAASIAVDGAAATAVLGQTLFTTATSALTQSGLNSPRGVNVSTTGRLWVADTANNRVLWFDSAAVKINGGIADGVLGQASFTTSASGVTSQKLDGPEGAFQDTSGHLWVADSNNNRALRFSSPASGSIPPVIRLTNAGRHIFPAASQHIKGTSSDADGRVVAVKGSVNGRPFTLAKGTTSWNFHAKKLRKGRNLIRIFALDDDGLQSNVLQVTIIRKNPRH